MITLLQDFSISRTLDWQHTQQANWCIDQMAHFENFAHLTAVDSRKLAYERVLGNSRQRMFDDAYGLSVYVHLRVFWTACDLSIKASPSVNRA
jgi:hypothetical protein